VRDSVPSPSTDLATITMEHELVSRQFGGPPMPQRSLEYLAENIAPRLLAVEGTLFAVAMTAVLMRFYVRIFMLKTFGWDDWMMLIAAVSENS
jgi:hypothetical protein